MTEENSPSLVQQPRLAKLGILIALALAGQFIARWIASRYITNLSAPAQNASIAIDVILLACVPFGFFPAPTLSLPGTPLLDRWMRREHAPELGRALYRSLAIGFISLAAALAVSMIRHSHHDTKSFDTSMPLPLAILLAVAAAFREEVEFRLGLLTVLTWLLERASRSISADSKSASLWIANVFQAMVFGALHQIAGFSGRTTTLTLTGIILEPRTASGLVLGFAYIRFGVEVAILSHAITDSAIFVFVAILARL